MRANRLLLAIAAVLSAALLLAPAAAALESAPGAGAAKAKKPKKCKKGQAKVKSGKRVLCVRLPKGAVQPRDEDPRLAAIKAGLTPSIVSAPDPKDKLPPPMEKVYRSFGPQALRGMERAVAGSLVRLDAAASRARLLGHFPAVAPYAFNGSGYTETIGNVTIDIRLNIAKVASAEFALTTRRDDGRTLTVTFEVPVLSSGYDGFHGDVCPGADGKLKAKDGLGITVRTEVRSNGGKTLDEYLIFKVIDKTDLRAEVGDDAKLDRLEINNQQEVWETSYSSSLYSGAQVKGHIVREGTVDMRSGNLNTTINNVEVGVVLSGIVRLFSSTAQAGIIQRLRKAADEGWQAAVKFQIDKFRELEKGWNEPNRCAKLEFGKKNGSLTLHRNDSNSETARVDAKPGGSPDMATWSVTDQANAFVTLAGGSANPTSFAYKVANAGKGVEVKATVRAVSKAGVAQDSWIQPTEQESIGKLVGSFSGEISQSTLNGPSVQSWSGTATLARTTPDVIGGPNGSYALESGGITYHVSGQEGLGVTGCQWSGTKVVELPAGSGSGSAGVFGTPPEYTAPYEYSIRIATPPLSTFTFTRHDCPSGAESYEGTEETIPFGAELDTEEQQSPDGIVYSGSKEESFGGSTMKDSWNFEGKP